MIFYGIKRVVKFDDNYGQIGAIDDFWEKLAANFPTEHFVSLGQNWGVNTFDYYIGKVNENWNEGTESVELPDTGWKVFECVRNDVAIQKMYEQIWAQGTLDYEIEERFEDTLRVRVHFAEEKEQTV